MWFFWLILYTLWSWAETLATTQKEDDFFVIIFDSSAQIKQVIETNQMIVGCRSVNRFKSVSPSEVYVTSDGQVMLIMTTEVVAIERSANTDWVVRLSGYAFMNITTDQYDT